MSMTVHFDTGEQINVSLSAATERLSASVGEVTVVTDTSVIPTYTGITSVTPTGAVQILSTAQKYALTDIRVEPIPSNYGRIDWNGSVMTIS